MLGNTATCVGTWGGTAAWGRPHPALRLLLKAVKGFWDFFFFFLEEGREGRQKFSKLQFIHTRHLLVENKNANRSNSWPIFLLQTEFAK